MLSPFTRQELKVLVLLGATGLAGLTVPLAVRSTPLAHQAAALRVNINTAGAEELAALPGIGPVTARRIVEYRRAHGRFLQIEDLARIKGLTGRQLAKFKSSVALE